jgi:hypothetical protein
MYFRCSLMRSSLGLCAVLLSGPLAVAQSGIAGTYRCVSFNVGGRGSRCISPPLVLKSDRQYQMSSEHGTYSIRGDRIFLSESRIRGAGQLLGDGEILFEYSYRGLQQSVTYRRDPQAGPTKSRTEPEEARFVPVTVTMLFPATDGSVGWINTAKLVPDGGATEGGYESLAITDGKQTVKAYFRAAARGRIYTLLVASGFETRVITKIDLRNASAPVKLTVRVPRLTRGHDRYTSPVTGPGYTAPRSR